MQGGMRRLKARFGQAVSLNVSAEPKTISIAGSMSDFQEAQKLLLDCTSTIRNALQIKRLRLAMAPSQ